MPALVLLVGRDCSLVYRTLSYVGSSRGDFVFQELDLPQRFGQVAGRQLAQGHFQQHRNRRYNVTLRQFPRHLVQGISSYPLGGTNPCTVSSTAVHNESSSGGFDESVQVTD
jgi:hypothetical protein